MSKTDTLKRRIDSSIEDYIKQSKAHGEALRTIKRSYMNDELRGQLQRESEKHATALSSISADFKRAAESELDRLATAVNRKLSAPVSAEALNALQVLRMRKNVSAQDIAAFKDRYGNNYSVMSVLKEIADEGDPTIAKALEDGKTGFFTGTAVLNMLNDLRTYASQIASGVAYDQGQFTVAMVHSLATQQLNVLDPALDALDPYKE
jgi:hypothetical protein